MNKQAFKRYLQTMSWNQNETFVDYGDLSYLHRDAYEAALRAELAQAEPFEFSYKRNAPKPQVGDRGRAGAAGQGGLECAWLGG
jgi:hypothetical protein